MSAADREVLVTGAGGFVGAHVAAGVAARGVRVAGIDRQDRNPAVPSNAAHVVGDCGAPGVLADVRAGRYAAVLHHAAISSTLERDEDLLARENVRTPLALAAACAASSTPFLYASSNSVYGRVRERVAVREDADHDRAACSGPLNAYARSKLALDDAMRAERGDAPCWAGLRYTNVFGTGEQRKGPMASILSQLVLGAAAGRRLDVFADTLGASRDYVPVADVVATCLAWLDRPFPSGIYNVGSGTAVSFASLLEWCAAFGGDRPLDVRLVPNPVASAYQYWTCADLSRLAAVAPACVRPEPEARERVRAAAAALYATGAGA